MIHDRDDSGSLDPLLTFDADHSFEVRDRRLLEAARAIVREHGEFDDDNLPAELRLDWALHLRDGFAESGLALFYGVLDDARFEELWRVAGDPESDCDFTSLLTESETELYDSLAESWCSAADQFEDEELGFFERTWGNFYFKAYSIGSFRFYYHHEPDGGDDGLGIVPLGSGTELAAADHDAVNRWLARLKAWCFIEELWDTDHAHLAKVASLDDLEAAESEYRRRCEEDDTSPLPCPIQVWPHGGWAPRYLPQTTSPVLSDLPETLDTQARESVLDFVLAWALVTRAARTGSFLPQLRVQTREWHEALGTAKRKPSRKRPPAFPSFGIRPRDRFPGIASFFHLLLGVAKAEVSDPVGHDRLGLVLIDILERSVTSTRGSLGNFAATLELAIESGLAKADDDAAVTAELALYALGWMQMPGLARLLAEEIADSTGGDREPSGIAARLTERIEALTLHAQPGLVPTSASALLTEAACLGLVVGFRLAGVDLCEEALQRALPAVDVESVLESEDDDSRY